MVKVSHLRGPNLAEVITFLQVWSLDRVSHLLVSHSERLDRFLEVFPHLNAKKQDSARLSTTRRNIKGRCHGGHFCLVNSSHTFGGRTFQDLSKWFSNRLGEENATH